MNIEQAAKEYAIGDPAFPYSEAGEPYKIRKQAFLAGIDHAQGAFAEWCSINSWVYIESFMQWQPVLVPAGEWKTTAELYQLWQQSLSQ